MEPEHFRFGGGVAETMLGPAVLGGMLIAIILILWLPRKYVIVPLMMSIFLCPIGQTLVVGGLHVFVVRILILFGWVRVVVSKSSGTAFFAGGYNVIDKAFTLWAIVRASSFMLLYWQLGAVINQCGSILDAFGGYFLLRWLIRDDEDIQRVMKTCALIVAILGVTMLYERFNGTNLYGVIGGVPIIPETRNGDVRAQGPFGHAILAGTFAATLFPLFFWLWKSGQSKISGIAGMIASSTIPFLTACSTPILAYGGAVVGLCFWPFRKQMRLVRWALVFALVGLQVVMKAPFWWAIQHVDAAGGSSSWHRALLVDQFIRHFGDWWLIGTKDNASWGHHTWDVANQYVAEGTAGGLATVLCFLAMIRGSFGRIGTARRSIEGSRKKEWYFWILGAALFSHVVAYFGISYFDSTRISWFALLAMISAATAPVLAAKGARGQPPEIAMAESGLTTTRPMQGIPA